MARFDVHRLRGRSNMLVVDVQAGFLSHLETRVVAPLLLGVIEEAAPRLKPVLEVDGLSYVLSTTEIAAIPRERLGDVVANLEGRYRFEITAALDFLLQGF